MTRPLPIAVLVSGEGTTMEALAERIEAGTLSARIVLVVADRPNIPALERAARHHVPTLLLPSRHVDREAWGQALTDALHAHGAELVILAGFLAILPPSWVTRWRGRTINLHPALLPRHGGMGMYGRHVHEAVLASKDAETGATVHLVTPDVDHGPILGQERLPVLPDDTPESLRARVHPVEVALLARIVEEFADGRKPLPYPERGAPPSGTAGAPRAPA